MAQAYCLVQDIKDDFKALVTAGASPVFTDAQITELIAQESSFIAARVGLRYVLPPDITDGSFVDAALILKRIAIFRVSERVRNKLEVKTNVSQAMDSDEKFNKNSVRTFKDDLDLIIKGLLLLPNVPLISAGSGVSSFNTDVGYHHKFKISKQQW